MMETGNLNIMQYLAAGREGGEVEFKQTTGQLERGMETLCAFLNGAGGTVLFGVKDNGKIIGQEVSDKTKRDIAEAIRLIEPFATITVSYADIPDTDKQVIALNAEEQRYMRPFTYKGRAYHRPGGSVGIAIYDDRVEIESSGAFPPDMTLEKLLGGHSSEPPNLIIANVLYKSELLENWGRGIRLMIDECRRVGISDPEFHTDGSSVWVVFRYKRETAGQAPDKYPTSIRQAPDKYPTSIVGLIEMIGERSCSLKEMMGMMELKDRENFLDNYLNPSMEAGWVEPLYPNQPTHPKQKYRLTEQGKALLQDGEKRTEENNQKH